MDMYICQGAFILWNRLLGLSKEEKLSFMEVTFLVLAISWFFATGGSDLVNFVILPIFILYLLFSRLQKAKFRISSDIKSARRILDFLGIPKRSLILSLIGLTLHSGKTWVGYIFFFCNSLLMLNIRFYSFGNIYESLFLSLIFVTVGLTFLGLKYKWKYLKFSLVALPLTAMGFLIFYFPLSVPLIRYSIETNVYPKMIPTIIGYIPTKLLTSFLPASIFFSLGLYIGIFAVFHASHVDRV